MKVRTKVIRHKDRESIYLPHEDKWYGFADVSVGHLAYRIKLLHTLDGFTGRYIPRNSPELKGRHIIVDVEI